DGTVGVFITSGVSNRTSVSVDLERFRLFDREAGIVGTAVGVRHRYAVGAGSQTADIFGGLAVAPQVGVWFCATAYYQVNRAVGTSITSCVSNCASVGVDLERFRLFNREAGIVRTAVGIGDRHAVSAGSQTADIFGGFAVAPQVGVWLGATCYYQVDGTVGVGVTACVSDC